MADIVYRIELTGLDGAGALPTGSGDSKDDKKFKRKPFTRKSVQSVIEGDISIAEGLVGVGTYIASRAASTYIRTVGLRTGDSYKQEDINFKLGLLSNIGGGAVSGALLGGPIGAVAGAVVGGVKTGIDAITAEYTAGIKRDWNIASAEETQRVMNYASYGNNRTGGALY